MGEACARLVLLWWYLSFSLGRFAHFSISISISSLSLSLSRRRIPAHGQIEKVKEFQVKHVEHLKTGTTRARATTTTAAAATSTCLPALVPQDIGSVIVVDREYNLPSSSSSYYYYYYYYYQARS